MATNFLPLCVGVTLTMVGGGIGLLHLALQLQRYGESRRDFLESLRFEKHARNFEGIAIALLFASWMPCSNAAWITQASCTLAIQQMAETQKQPEPVNEIATKIAKRDAMPADYQVTLQNGATVSWSLGDVTLSGVHRRGRSVNAGRSASGTRIVGGPVAGSDELRNGGSNAGGIVWIGSEQTDGNQTF